jgi:hypothetical protein
LTFSSRLPDRDEDGWKIKRKATKGSKRSWDGSVLEKEFEVLEDCTELMEDDMGWYEPKVMTEEMRTMLKAMRAHPKLVKPVHRLESDVAALFFLTHAVEAPRRQIRMACQMKVIYGFGDLSGNGFGSSIRLPSGEVVWRSGMWNRTMVEEHNSNFFELANLIMALEDLQVKGRLARHEIFMFTDNITAEATHFNGTTKHRKQLFDLMLRLRKLEMNGECQVHLIHVDVIRCLIIHPLVRQGSRQITTACLVKSSEVE